MARQARTVAETGIYHAMVRGVSRNDIFLEDLDRQQFLKALFLAKETSSASILAYCLMTNHVHLLLRTGTESLGVTMKRLGVRYAGWFNHKYGRTGHLFQDRFLSVPVNDDTYFLTVLRYLWDNPVKAGLVPMPTAYRWNSCAPGQPTGLVDEDALTALLPSLAALELAKPLSSSPFAPRTSVGGRPPRHNAAEAARLLTDCCNVLDAAEFAGLELTVKQWVVGQLRARSVAYAAIAAVTGLSTTGVRRLHLSSRDGNAVA